MTLSGDKRRELRREFDICSDGSDAIYRSVDRMLEEIHRLRREALVREVMLRGVQELTIENAQLRQEVAVLKATVAAHEDTAFWGPRVSK